MGKVLSKHRVGPTETKVEAVSKAREPEKASEFGSFLGLMNFNVQFIPDPANDSGATAEVAAGGRTIQVE